MSDAERSLVTGDPITDEQIRLLYKEQRIGFEDAAFALGLASPRMVSKARAHCAAAWNARGARS